jgi:hypothetical protein
MKRLNQLGVKLGFTKKPKFSEQLIESVGKSAETHRETTLAAQESISTPIFSKLVESAGQEGRARFLDAMTSVTGPIHASELREFPTADCLHPEEVYEKEKLGPERLAHLGQCSWCQTMVSGSHSSPEDAAAWIRANESRIHTRRRVASRGRSTV